MRLLLSSFAVLGVVACEVLSSTTADCWQGPGHGAVVKAPDGGDVFVHHAWEKGKIGNGHPRVELADRITWKTDGWPAIENGKPCAWPLRRQPLMAATPMR